MDVQRSKATRKIWPQVDALKLAMNWSERDLDKLQILVDDVQGESHPGSYHLDVLAGQVSQGILESGGKAARFHATDICDGWAEGHDGMNYILLSREIIANLVEIHGNVIPWDGLVLLSSCDKSVPAHLIAAARLDLPTVHVPGGSQHVGPDMTTAGLCGRLCAREKRGEPVQKEMRNYKLSNCPTCGVCQFMGTASTMQCMSEALGLALPGTALGLLSVFLPIILVCADWDFPFMRHKAAFCLGVDSALIGLLVIFGQFFYGDGHPAVPIASTASMLALIWGVFIVAHYTCWPVPFKISAGLTIGAAFCLFTNALIEALEGYGFRVVFNVNRSNSGNIGPIIGLILLAAAAVLAIIQVIILKRRTRP